MAIQIIDHPVNALHSAFLDRVALAQSRRGRYAHRYEVVRGVESGAPTREELPFSTRQRPAASLVRVQLQPDRKPRLLWAVGARCNRNYLELCGEEFEFSARKVRAAWVLSLPATAPADLADWLS